MNLMMMVGFAFCLLIGILIPQASMVYQDVSQFFNLTNNNLSSVTWAHAVNSRSLLNYNLNSTVMMLEADVVIGKINGTGNDVPIMAHPPANTSDLSLKAFLNQVHDHNQLANSSQVKKGIKLDFKSIEALESSIPDIEELYNNMTYPVWINADIISGPVNATATPVNATGFFENTKNFENSTLSVGWTTNYGANFSASSYTDNQISAMLTSIRQNNVNQSITFPVRAGIAAESLSQMQTLLSNVSGSTLTIWSSEGDSVDVEKLRELVLSVGVNKTFIDVPEDLLRQLDLGRGGGDSVTKPALMLLAFFVLAIIFL